MEHDLDPPTGDWLPLRRLERGSPESTCAGRAPSLAGAMPGGTLGGPVSGAAADARAGADLAAEDWLTHSQPGGKPGGVTESRAASGRAGAVRGSPVAAGCVGWGWGGGVAAGWATLAGAGGSTPLGWAGAEGRSIPAADACAAARAGTASEGFLAPLDHMRGQNRGCGGLRWRPVQRRKARRVPEGRSANPIMHTELTLSEESSA